MNMQQFIEKWNISFKANPISVVDNPWCTDFSSDGQNYLLRLYINNAPKAVFYYWMGSLAGDPDLVDILSNFQLECRAILNCADFESWASEFDYDTDSRRAYKIYENCQELYFRVRDQLFRDVDILSEFLEIEEE